MENAKRNNLMNIKRRHVFFLFTLLVTNIHANYMAWHPFHLNSSEKISFIKNLSGNISVKVMYLNFNTL